MDNDKIEAVASSFYAVEFDSHSWNSAPEFIKEQFRFYARSAIALCKQDHGYFEQANNYPDAAFLQPRPYIH
jgi:hypothetical protein